MSARFFAKFTSTRPEETARLARQIAGYLTPGDAILLSGPIGAGKTHFARSLIQALLRATGRNEDVPSPTYTIVQTYEGPACEIWHADLYRVTGPEEALELGLDEAFVDAICLVEWPDRLESLAPANAMSVEMLVGEAPGVRTISFSATHPKWQDVFDCLAKSFSRESTDV